MQSSDVREAERRPDLEKPRVVVLGGGFAGIQVVRKLKRAGARITLIDRSNHHLFQPLLYQVATAGLSPADIAVPIREVFRNRPDVEVLMAEVVGVDARARRVILEDDRPAVPYDFLVVATGARHSYFAHPEWEEFAPGLKTVLDATAIRRKILIAFERAELEVDPERRRELLNFVIVGGGPTGVELAGSIAELSHRTLREDFRNIDPATAKILLVEAGPRLLASFPEGLAEASANKLRRLGVEIRSRSRVEAVDEVGVIVNGERIRSRNVIWAAGVVASPVGRWLGVEIDRSARVKVGADLSVPGLPEVFVIGDAAHFVQDGETLPGVAPVAMQQGRYVGKLLASRLKSRGRDRVSGVDEQIQMKAQPFRYINKGNLATIGRTYAVADLGWLRLRGWIAWLAWVVVHVYYLIDFRNRLLVLTQWAWAYSTWGRGARLIVEPARALRSINRAEVESQASKASGPRQAKESG
jgi:NADH dehydrogenase